MRITVIVGTRPNFIKIAPIIKAFKQVNQVNNVFQYRIVHTGQHYDANMSDSFFRDLGIPEPDANLGCGGGSQSEQAAAIMVAFEIELSNNPAELVLVVGDVTSTMACSIVAKKCNVKVAHVEAGIRSFDQTMPEEINRMVTDSITDFFFTTSQFANANLRKAGVSETNIFFVGNVMVDTLLENRSRFRQPAIFDSFGLKKGKYLVLTLHRPSNVDDLVKLKEILETIIDSSNGSKIIFPVHPRTKKGMSSLDNSITGALLLTEPLGYLEFNYLVENCLAVITDSGGITEETTVMGIPCITLRDNTERPETVTIGTNELVGTNPIAIRETLERLFNGEWKKGGIPELWDGNSANRIMGHLGSLID
jgi:UDP-N-acetylglucosamine 2-epimerase (non-hydrolysing)